MDCVVVDSVATVVDVLPYVATAPAADFAAHTPWFVSIAILLKTKYFDN